MNYLPEHLIDACLAQLNSGIDLEAVLAEHPNEADALRPILAAAAWVRMDIPPPVRRLEGKDALMAACAQRRREVETTQGYINEIKAGVPLDELLAGARPEVRPMLVAAWRMHTTNPPAPDPEKLAAGKLALMAMVEARRAQAQAAQPATVRLRAGLAGLWQGLAPRPSLVRRAWAGSLAALTTLLVIGLGTAGVSTAAAASLPGDTFYPLKRLGEHARLWLAVDPAQRAELDAQISAERLAEINHLIDEGREISASMLADWLRGQPDALDRIQRLPEATQARLGAQVQDLVAQGTALGDLAGDPTLAGDLRQWLNELDRASESARSGTATGSPAAEPSGQGVQRPMPVEDGTPLGAAKPEPKQADAPPAEAVDVAAPPVAPNQPPPAAPEPQVSTTIQQSGGGYGPDDDSDKPRDPDARTGANSPTALPAPSATPTSQQIIQVPMDPDPTQTPTPGGAGGAEPTVPAPNDPGVEPMPSATPLLNP